MENPTGMKWYQRASLGQPGIVTRGLLLAVAGLLGGCADDEVLQHDVVKLEFVRSLSEASSPYVGTEVVLAIFEYNECLRNFYAANPNWMQDGVDGASVFEGYDSGGEGWKDRLCEPAPSDIECRVESFTQTGIALTVRYAILNDDMENRELPFGPIPKAELAGCDPRISQIPEAPITGNNSADTRIWRSESVNPAIAAPGQGREMRISAARQDT